jgi:hypothetical protein
VVGRVFVAVIAVTVLASACSSTFQGHGSGEVTSVDSAISSDGAGSVIDSAGASGAGGGQSSQPGSPGSTSAAGQSPAKVTSAAAPRSSATSAAVATTGEVTFVQWAQDSKTTADVSYKCTGGNVKLDLFVTYDATVSDETVGLTCDGTGHQIAVAFGSGFVWVANSSIAYEAKLLVGTNAFSDAKGTFVVGTASGNANVTGFFISDTTVFGSLLTFTSYCVEPPSILYWTISGTVTYAGNTYSTTTSTHVACDGNEHAQVVVQNWPGVSGEQARTVNATMKSLDGSKSTSEMATVTGP